MARRGGTKDERPDPLKEEHRRIAAEMYFKGGKSQREIATTLTISPATVNRDLKEVTRRNVYRGKRAHQQYLEELVTELKMVKVEAWAGWKESKQEELSIAGNVQFLNLIEKCLMDLYKVLGGQEDKGITLSPETMVFMQVLGINTSDVAKAFNEMMANAAMEKLSGQVVEGHAEEAG